MVRNGSIVLGIGLVILWLTGLYNHATPWLTWLDGLGALAAFVAAGSLTPAMGRLSLIAGPTSIAVGLFVLSIIGLNTMASRWLSWWTFVFGCGFLLLGLIGVSRTGLQRPRPRPA